MAFVKLQLLLVSVLSSRIFVVDGVSCVQCDSILNPLCTEFDTRVPPTPCEGLFRAEYCVKTTGLYGGVIGTKRFCSSRDLFDQCQDFRFTGLDRTFRGCIYTCAGNGCNAASTILTNQKLSWLRSTVGVVVVAVVVALRFN